MKTKDAGMRIRVEKDLRDAFIQSCHAANRPAAEVLRDFMRGFAEKEGKGGRKPAPSKSQGKAA